MTDLEPSPASRPSSADLAAMLERGVNAPVATQRRAPVRRRRRARRPAPARELRGPGGGRARVEPQASRPARRRLSLPVRAEWRCPAVVDWEPRVRAILADLRAGVAAGRSRGASRRPRRGHRRGREPDRRGRRGADRRLLPERAATKPPSLRCAPPGCAPAGRPRVPPTTAASRSARRAWAGDMTGDA